MSESEPLAPPPSASLVALGVVLIGAAWVYLATLCPTTYFLDSGELATAAWTAGISHPPGQPLWTMVNWLFAHLVPVGQPAMRVNLCSAMTSLAGSVLAAFTVWELFNWMGLSRNKDWGVALTGPLASGLYAIAGTTWLYATVTEVYALHGVFLWAVLWTSIRAVRATDPSICRRRTFLGAFVYGLAWSNHPSIVLVGPALLWIMFRAWWWRQLLANVPLLIAGLALGLLPELYLPLRAAANPAMNWGNPITWDAFWRQITAWQYQSYAGDYLKSVPGGLAFYFGNVFWDDLPAWLLPFFVFGIIRTLKVRATLRPQSKIPDLGIFLAILYVIGVGVSVGYGTTEQRPYFALAGVVAIAWTCIGAHAVSTWLRTEAPNTSFLITGFVLMSLVVFAAYRWKNYDRSRVLLAEEVGRDALETVPSQGMLITTDWELYYSPILYLQLVRNIRPDVIVFDPELFRRSWYADRVRPRLEPLPAEVEAMFDQYRKGVDRFESGQHLDGDEQERLYRALIGKILSRMADGGKLRGTPDARAWMPYPANQDRLLLQCPGSTPQTDIPPFAQRLIKGSRPADSFSQRWGITIAKFLKHPQVP